MHGLAAWQDDGPLYPALMETPLLQVRNLKKYFPIQRGVFAQTVGHVRAVDDVSFDLGVGRSLGLVGESGSGKTTAGRCLLRLIEPTSGNIHFDGTDFSGLSRNQLRPWRRQMQMIFQDPYSSLNARHTIGSAIAEPMLQHGLSKNKAEARDKTVALLERVGLGAEHLNHYPHQFSGGQRQRIGIARALAVEPRMIVCDEAVSALDVSVQAQVLNVLMDLQDELQMSYVFIAHDLAVVAHVCHDVAVMYLGEIVEQGPVEHIYKNPMHPYTQALLSAIPPDYPGQKRQRIRLAGDTPSPMEPSSAERFIKRFPDHQDAFTGGPITMHDLGDGHFVRCARPDILQQMATALQAT